MTLQTMPEKRKTQRITLDHEASKCYVEIPLPVPKGATIKKEIIDISDEGLSFLMPEEEGVFFVNTPLANITVVKENKRSYFPRARVVYSEKTYGEGIDYRIGLQFIRDKESPGHDKCNAHGLNGYPHFRLPRYDGKQLGSIRKLITIKNNAGAYSSYELVNFSKYGLAFRVKESELEESQALRVGEVLEVRVIISYKKIYEGRATVVDFREQDNQMLVGLKLEHLWIEVDKVLYLGKTENIKNSLKQFLNDLPVGDKVSGEFKQIVADMRYYLEAIESKLKEKESRFNDMELPLKHKAEKDILRTLIKPFSEAMDHWIIELNNIVTDFTKQEHETHKRYFQGQLHPLLLQAPVIRRSVEKPFAYSGDYITINMLLNNAYDGDTLLGKLISKHAYNTIAARVVRLRKAFINRLILEKLIGCSNNHNPSILTIGSGPAREIDEVIKASNGIKCQFCLLDFDTRPLYHVEERLSMVNKSNKVEIRFLHKSLRAVLKEKDRFRYDLIYSLGLTDYLGDNICKMLVSSFFARLREGGVLVVGQYAPEMHTRCYMEYALDWHLIYRDFDDMSKWLSPLKGVSKKDHRSILDNAYNLIVATK